MKRVWLLSLSFACLSMNAHAADLLAVYQQAKLSSPWLKLRAQQRDAQTAAAHAARGAVLPQLNLTGSAYAQRVSNISYESSTVQATLSQDVFNLSDWGQWRAANKTALSQNATYRYQEQTFVVNVLQGYFNVLLAQDNVTFSKANVAFLRQTLFQTRHEVQVGLKTITDLKQAEANYDQAIAELIKDENDKQVAIQALRVYTGKLYTQLAPLKKNFPFVAPKPANIHYWVNHAVRYNAQLQAERYTTQSSRENVVTQYGNHLPQVSLVATYTRNDNNLKTADVGLVGFNHQDDITGAVQLTWNILQGGTLFAQQTQAAKQYTSQLNTQENTYRTTVSTTRQDYLAVMSELSQVKSYQRAVVAGEASLKQLEAKYRVGTETIVNVLDELQKLYQAKQNLAQAQYAYIMNIVKLKRDAGTLTEHDVKALNSWLGA